MDNWTLTANEPATGRLYLANGYMSTALDFSAGLLFESPPAPCYIRGVYSDTGPGGVDRFTIAPCWSQIRYNMPASVRDYRRELDLKRGHLRTTMTLAEERGEVVVEHQIFVCRHDPHRAAIRLTLVPDFEGEIGLLAGTEALYTEGLKTHDIRAGDHGIWLRCTTSKYNVEIDEALSFNAEGWEWEDIVGSNIVTRSFHRTLSAGECVELIQTVCVETSADGPLASTARADSASASPGDLAATVNARGPIASNDAEAWSNLLAQHTRAWEDLWRTDVEIDGDPEVQQFARAGLFYLWCSIHEGDDWSIAPMGLSSNGYNGHIFWDAELWMYPSLLVTHPALARSCVAYREKTIDAARVRAASDGCRGARFPWEGAFTGDEMTPTFAETRDFQIHITADVALGQWWYFINSTDVDWLRRHGYPVMRECAEFWVSRVEHDEERGRYTVSDVVCADEYAAHVDNDAFTNAAIRQSLLCTVRAAEILGEPVPPTWRNIADRIYIPYDDERKIHLEFDGFDGRVTKQADVELLAYPLELTTDHDQIARDLDYYARVIDPNGPAMSFSTYSIVSAQLGRAQAAYDYLLRSYVPNVRPPFYGFSETPTNNEFMFCTGIGGALQTLLYGLSGLRLREDHVQLSPILPPHWRRLRLRNLFLRGTRVDVDVERGRIALRPKLFDTEIELAVTRRPAGLELTVTGTATNARAATVVTRAAGSSPPMELRVAPGERSVMELPDMLDRGVRCRVSVDGASADFDCLLRQAPGPEGVLSPEHARQE